MGNHAGSREGEVHREGRFWRGRRQAVPKKGTFSARIEFFLVIDHKVSLAKFGISLTER